MNNTENRCFRNKNFELNGQKVQLLISQIYSASRLTVATQQTFLQVSQSGYANFIDRHASRKSFDTQPPNGNSSILTGTDKVEAKAQQLYKTGKLPFVVICSRNCGNSYLNLLLISTKHPQFRSILSLAFDISARIPLFGENNIHMYLAVVSKVT